MAVGETEERYDAAISFAGENRAVAKDLVTRLVAKGYRVFYDEHEQARLWGEDLVEQLTHVYGEQARFCLILVSAKYVDKVWTRLELKSANAGALFGAAREGRVLPVRLDDTELPGLLPTVGYLDLRKMSVADVVEVLVQKLSDGPASVVDRPRRRVRLFGLLTAGAVALAAGVIFALDGFGVLAASSQQTTDPSTSSLAPTSTADTPASTPASTSQPVAPPATTSTSRSPMTLDPPPPIPKTTPTLDPPPFTQLAFGSLTLLPTDGLDLDRDVKGGQYDVGMDISPGSNGDRIDGMAHGKPKLAVVTSPAPTGPDLCRTVPEASWTTPLLGTSALRKGDRICVRTDRGNYAVLTLRKVPSAADVNLDIDYIAWETR